jgi:hypothetical protein
MKLTATILSTFAAFALATLPMGCDDKKEGDKKTEEKKSETKDGKVKTETKTEEVKTEPAKKEEPAAAEGGAAAAGGGGADKIGIAECDEYIEKYTKCINDKVPEAARGSMNDAMGASVKAWKEAAAGPGKDSLAAGCKAALDAAKQATASMGCEW